MPIPQANPGNKPFREACSNRSRSISAAWQAEYFFDVLRGNLIAHGLREKLAHALPALGQVTHLVRGLKNIGDDRYQRQLLLWEGMGSFPSEDRRAGTG